MRLQDDAAQAVPRVEDVLCTVGGSAPHMVPSTQLVRMTYDVKDADFDLKGQCRQIRIN